ncbi:hypothetical protein [Streptomyces sp. GESEQ-35]|uniref:hypothetical protein n=1 Tax=Streptomyces sp. GESEQ-35 TaxID=2812657 RepID=UPI001B31A76E|nr:hypothetical protein [Streptomyces sp. GESEQ-35]
MNHGPDDQSLPGLDSDELALRRMLHDAVQEVEPRDGTLDHLRRAVPARRARKRQALVGMAAAALFVGTAVPALLHVSNVTGSATNTSNAGHASQAQGGVGQDKGPDGGENTSGGSSGQGEDKGQDGGKKDDDTDSGSGTGGPDATTAGADPTATTTVGAPLCTAEQLGTATPTTDAPDSANAVYGTFRVTNISTTDCKVTSPGTVSMTPAGAADATKISTLRHVSGDAAASLPDPSLEAPELLLTPGAAYEVKFAWVPSETCPTTGDSDGGNTGEPTPDPTPTDGTGSTTGTTTGTDTGTSTQLVTEDGTADGSVTVANTAEPGAPTASATVSGACAGSVYWTGLLTVS